MSTSAVLLILSVTSMPDVRMFQGLIFVLVKLDLPEMEKVAPVRIVIYLLYGILCCRLQNSPYSRVTHSRVTQQENEKKEREKRDTVSQSKFAAILRSGWT